MSLSKLFKRQMPVKVILINKNILHILDAQDYRDFLLVANKPYPKPDKFYLSDDCIYYIIKEDEIDAKYDPRVLDKLIKAKVLESSFETLRPKIPLKQLLGYMFAFGLLGFYMRDNIEKLSMWLERIIVQLTPEQVQFYNNILLIAFVGAIFYMIFSGALRKLISRVRGE